jgi:hypothetical protein
MLWLASEALRWRTRCRRLEQTQATAPSHTEVIAPPDLASEWAFEREIRDNDGRTDQDVDEWIKHVEMKLLGWNPKAARYFAPTVVPPTPEAIRRTRAMLGGPTVDTLAEFRRMNEGDPILTRLKKHADHLAEILSSPEKF